MTELDTNGFEKENPTHFVQVIELRLARDGNLKQEFLSGFKSHISNETHFKQSLLPLEGEGYGGDSLCRLLLKVYCIQRDILRTLFGILGTLSVDEEFCRIIFQNTAVSLSIFCIENIRTLLYWKMYPN